MRPRQANRRIIHTWITSRIRVSTAAIWYEEEFGKYYQFETWCFSEDPDQRSFQKIHGTGGLFRHFYLIDPIRVHGHIVKNLRRTHAHKILDNP